MRDRTRLNIITTVVELQQLQLLDECCLASSPLKCSAGEGKSPPSNDSNSNGEQKSEPHWQTVLARQPACTLNDAGDEHRKEDDDDEVHRGDPHCRYAQY